MTDSEASPPEKAESGRKQRRERFSKKEDEKLARLVNIHGAGNWDEIAELMGKRKPRQCKDRWINFLSPSINCGPWADEEEELLSKKYAEYGGKWSLIKKSFPYRSDTSLKNHWMILMRREKKDGNESPSAKPKTAEKDGGQSEDKPFVQQLFELMIQKDQWNILCSNDEERLL